MRYNTLGRTGLDVSTICLGTMTWGLQNTFEEACEQMDYAIGKGVNFFDTAELYSVPASEKTYGKTEEIIGQWFAERGGRDKIILASKIAGPGRSWVRGGKAYIDRKNILEAIEGSLNRLQTDYIDIYQLHWPNRDHYHFQKHWDYDPKFSSEKEEENFIEVLETLEALIKEGKIRYAGLSNESAWGTIKYLELAKKHDLPRMVSIQNEYSLLNRMFDLDLAEVALAEDIGLLAWSPLSRGMLSGKYLDGARPKGSRWTYEKNPSRDTLLANDAIQAYMKVAEKHGLDVCQMALAFVHARPFLTSTIIGATSMEQLKSNIASIDLTLSLDCSRDIEEVYRRYTRPY